MPASSTNRRSSSGMATVGVGIVELYRVCVGKMGEILAMGRAVSTHHVLQRRAGEEILLLEAQALACVGVCRWGTAHG